MRPLDLVAIWPIVTQLAARLEVRRPAASMVVAEVAMAVKAVEAAALVNSVTEDVAAAMVEVEEEAALAASVVEAAEAVAEPKLYCVT